MFTHYRDSLDVRPSVRYISVGNWEAVLRETAVKLLLRHVLAEPHTGMQHVDSSFLPLTYNVSRSAHKHRARHLVKALSACQMPCGLPVVSEVSEIMPRTSIFQRCCSSRRARHRIYFAQYKDIPRVTLGYLESWLEGL